MCQKKGKRYGKLLLDLILVVLLALMYRKQAISMHFHETGGLVLCGLFLLHKALNWKWIRAVTGGMIQGRAKLNARWIVDVLLLLSMTAVLITGLLISKTFPTAIASARGLQVWHYFFASAALVLSGVHLGLHGAYLKNALWNRLPLSEKTRHSIGVLLLCALFCFGSFSLITLGFIRQFTRPFASVTMSQGSEYPGFEEMEHVQGSGNGMGKGQGMGKGMDNGMGEGNGSGRGRGIDHPVQGASAGSAISTFAAYASILCWFAIVTAVLEYWMRCRRRKKTLAISDAE